MHTWRYIFIKPSYLAFGQRPLATHGLLPTFLATHTGTTMHFHCDLKYGWEANSMYLQLYGKQPRLSHSCTI